MTRTLDRHVSFFGIDTIKEYEDKGNVHAERPLARLASDRVSLFNEFRYSLQD